LLINVPAFMSLPRHTKSILLIGLCLCLICALFPPRTTTTTSSFQFDTTGGKLIPTRAFLFAPDFGIYIHPNGTVLPTVVDGGQLLAELVLIASSTGILIVVFKPNDAARSPESDTKKVAA
jgi:hypothetical protein